MSGNAQQFNGREAKTATFIWRFSFPSRCVLSVFAHVISAVRRINLSDENSMKWETIIRSYKLNNRPNKQNELNWFRQQSSLEAAINLATKAKDEDGKHYSHQRRIPQTAILEANQLLLEKHNVLQECKSFHELWLLIRETLISVRGIRELYIYDTALRIGAYLNFFPDRVYLHRGTLEGAKAFGFVTKKQEWLSLDELPKSFSELSAHEIEDMLCIYKNEQLPPKNTPNKSLDVRAKQRLC